MFPNKPIKQLFNANDNWLNYLYKYRETLRAVVIENAPRCSLAVPQLLALKSIDAVMLTAPTTNTFTKRANLAFAAVVVLKRQSSRYESNNMSFLSVSINTLR